VRPPAQVPLLAGPLLGGEMNSRRPVDRRLEWWSARRTRAGADDPPGINLLGRWLAWILKIAAPVELEYEATR